MWWERCVVFGLLPKSGAGDRNQKRAGTAVVAARSEGGDAARENASNRHCGVRCAGVRLHHRCGRCRGGGLGAFGCPLGGAWSHASGEALCLTWLLQAQGARAPVSAPPERNYLATFAGLERQHALPHPRHAGRVCAAALAIACCRCGGPCYRVLSPRGHLLSRAIAAGALTIACCRCGSPCYRVLSPTESALSRAIAAGGLAIAR